MAQQVIQQNEEMVGANHPTKSDTLNRAFLVEHDAEGRHNTSFAPTGEIRMFGGSVAPSGFLLCQGQAVSRTTYADLFAVVGISFGAGNGSTTFNVPDMRERLPRGKGSGDSLGDTGGSDTVDFSHDHTLGGTTDDHTLLAAEIPAHTHGVQCTTGTGASAAVVYTMTADGGGLFLINTQGGSYGGGPHSHGVSSITVSTELSATQSIKNPYTIVNFIIKT